MSKIQVKVVRREITRKATDAERLNMGVRWIVVGVRYYVEMLICEGMFSDGMWTSIQHSALFADRSQAEKLAERVRKVGFAGVNLAYWLWSPSVTQVFSALQKQPTAKEYNVD